MVGLGAGTCLPVFGEMGLGCMARIYPIRAMVFMILPVGKK